jgi:hypothetical protein
VLKTAQTACKMFWLSSDIRQEAMHLHTAYLANGFSTEHVACQHDAISIICFRQATQHQSQSIAQGSAVICSAVLPIHSAVSLHSQHQCQSQQVRPVTCTAPSSKSPSSASWNWLGPCGTTASANAVEGVAPIA